MNTYLTEILGNKILITGAVSWIISQILKTIIHLIVNHKIVMERLMGDGGMPSSHSATVASVATATGIHCGLGSPEFAIALFMAIIVMHDARGVRRETGKQAVVINNMVEWFVELGNSDMTPEETLKEFVGHTPMQVLAGGLLGVIVACIVNLII